VTRREVETRFDNPVIAIAKNSSVVWTGKSDIGISLADRLAVVVMQLRHSRQSHLKNPLSLTTPMIQSSTGSQRRGKGKPASRG
jgi:hypothetical protein